MNKMKEKYLNFDGMPSEVPNDMPWSDTVWSNQSGRMTEDEVVRVSEIYGTALNAAGEQKCPPGTVGVWPECSSPMPGGGRTQDTITLDHYDNRLGPNMVLELPDSDSMGKTPDSDQWSNHPGFLGGTWWKDFWRPGEAEKERAEEARRSIEAKYPVTGSCDLLTDTAYQIEERLDKHGGASGKGAKRVAKREIPILKNRLKTVARNRDTECEAEAAAAANTMNASMLAAPPPQRGTGITPTTLIIGALVIGGAIWGISRLTKPRA